MSCCNVYINCMGIKSFPALYLAVTAESAKCSYSDPSAHISHRLTAKWLEIAAILSHYLQDG